RPIAAGRRRRGAGGVAVHAVRRPPEGAAAGLHGRGPAGGRRAVVRLIRGAVARSRRGAGGNGALRREHGGAAVQRWTGDADARLVGVAVALRVAGLRVQHTHGCGRVGGGGGDRGGGGRAGDDADRGGRVADGGVDAVDGAAGAAGGRV